MPLASSVLERLTADTLEDVAKSVTTGILASTGIQGVDLAPFVALVPVNVPARNNTSAFPRQIAGMGSKFALWRSLLNINQTQTDPAVGTDYAGSQTKFLEQDVQAYYKALGKFGRVTQTAIAQAQNYVDALAEGELQTLNQLFIGQDIHIINSQVYHLPAMGSVAGVTHTTGGTIAKTKTVKVRVAARSGWNFYYGKAGHASTAHTTKTGTTTTTNKVTFTWAAVKGAVAYDVWIATGAGTYYYYTTVTVNSVTVTFVPTANQHLPASLVTHALMSKVAPVVTTLTHTHSFSANCYAGVIASILGDYGPTGPVTPGTGTPSGGIFLSWTGAQPALQGNGINVLDKINYAIWGQVQLSPTAYMVNAQQGNDISQLALGTSAAFSYLPPTDADARTNLASGGFIGRYINRAAGGVPVAIEVHPHVPPGTIIARTDRVPFPGSNIGTVFEVRCQYDTMRFDYAANWNPTTAGGGPRYDFEIRSKETLINRAPLACAVVSNVAPLDTTY